MLSSARNGWPLAISGLALLFGLLVVLHADMFLHVAGIWNRWSGGEYYAHGYLALLMSAYMVFHDRKQLASFQPCPSIAGIVLLLAAVFLWLVADLGDVLLLAIIAILLMVVAVLWTVLGWTVVRVLLPPVVLLVFALPIWGPLPPLLQLITADAAYALSRIAGLPAFLQGQVIILPAGSLEVEQSCSGLSYLLAALTLGVFYGWMYHQGWLRRLLVIIIAGITALVANFLRVFIVVYVGYKTDMQHPMIHDHFNLGFYLFGALALVLIIIDGMILRRSGKDHGATGSLTVTESSCHAGTPLLVTLTLSAAVLLAGGPLLANHSDRVAQAVPVHALRLPAGAGGWTGPVKSAENWEPVYHGAIPHKRDYHKDGNQVTLYLGFYPYQEQGRELVFYLNRIADTDLWRVQNPRQLSVAQDAWQAREEILISAGGERRLVWYWYRVAGRTTTSRYISKFLHVVGQLTGNTRASVVAVLTEASEDELAARQRLEDFVSAMRQQLEQLADGKSG